MNIKAIIYPVLLILIGGCGKSFLQRDNPNSIAEDLFYQNEQEATFGLYGVYDALQHNQLYGNFFNLLDEISDNGTNGTASNGFREFEESAHSPLSVRAQGFYTYFYNVIREANYVVARVAAMHPGQISEAGRGRIIAEASVLRALAYFHLVNLFRDVPFYTEQVTAFSEGKGATGRADIYAFMKEDLARSIPALPAVVPPGEAGRAGRAAAIALLGKVHLYDNEFAKASAQLGRLFSSEFQLSLYPDYAKLFTPGPDAEFSSEIILQVNFINDGVENGESFSERIDTAAQPIKPRQYFTPGATLVNSYLCTDGKPIADSELYGTRSPLYNSSGVNRFYNRDPRLRANIFTAADVLPSGKNLWRFSGVNDFAVRKYIEVTSTQYAAGAGPQNAYIIRYADVLLMYAEATNEIQGPVDSVYWAVNAIRDRVDMPSYPAGLNKEQMKQMIRDERRWEFAFESQRYFDLKRWGILKDALLNAGIAKKRFTDPRDWVWPVPQTELDNNPNMLQAEEWR